MTGGRRGVRQASDESNLAVSSVAFHPKDDSILLLGTADGRVFSLDCDSGKLALIDCGQLGYRISRMAMADDARTLWANTDGGGVWVHNSEKDLLDYRTETEMLPLGFSRHGGRGQDEGNQARRGRGLRGLWIDDARHGNRRNGSPRGRSENEDRGHGDDR